MPSKPVRDLYEYAVVRFIPRIEREEFVNVGLVMMCKRRRWIRVKMGLNREKALALWPKADIGALESQLCSFALTAEGRESHSSAMEVHERFRWLTAVRSACIATSRPHPGLSDNLDLTFDRLFDELVDN
ncbi:MAG: DUF3037 domain-containing protein [Pseudoflavonifractor sp.]|nr:DUF3037 domain-containing protein [Alloprevotella sp.]MCM1117320.1 DUF3037 domain-containing protein [Pseudoflavonifractor sp.]